MLIKKNIFSELSAELGIFEEDYVEEDAHSIVAKTFNSHDGASDVPAADREAMLKEIQAEAEEIIKRSQQEAKEILDSAEEKIKEEAEKAVKDKLKSLEELEAKALKEIEELVNAQKEIVQESKKTILDLSVELASKIINKKVREDSSILETTFKEVVDQMMLNPDESIKLNFLVHPKDKKIAQDFVKELENKSSSIEISVNTDENVAEGSCIVETPSGALDLNFSTQLQIFKERMLEEKE